MSAHLQVHIEEAPPEEVTIETLLTRGVDQVMPENGLREMLESGRRRLYLGIDPTGPKLHIGHTVPLRKLRQFQQLGHEVLLLFGTFTGMIGDPSDKSAARKRLTPEQVDKNVATYKEQAGKVLDLTEHAENPVAVVFNHEWLSPLNFEKIVDLASNFTVNQMIAREIYAKRLKEGVPLYLHELLYPLMQGFDSVALDVDLEVGGKDQVPNMLAGRTLMNSLQNKEKWVMGMKLIADESGAKMGKTTGNMVTVLDLPESMYEALMSWSDGMLPSGLETLTSVPMVYIEQVRDELKRVTDGTSTTNPMDLKEAFAFRAVAELHGQPAAIYARMIYDQVKRQKLWPSRMIEVHLERGVRVTDALVASELARDLDEAKSKIGQQAVRLDGKQTKDISLGSGEHILELGKNSIKNVRRLIVS